MATASFCQCRKSSWFLLKDFHMVYYKLTGSFFLTFILFILGVFFLPFGESCTAGHECMLGSAMYLKSTGISLKNKIAIICITKVRSSFNKQFYLNLSFKSSMCFLYNHTCTCLDKKTHLPNITLDAYLRQIKVVHVHVHIILSKSSMKVLYGQNQVNVKSLQVYEF